VLLVFAYPAVERLLSSKQQSAETPKLWLPQPAGQMKVTPRADSKQESVAPDKAADTAIEAVEELTPKPAETEAVQVSKAPKKEVKLVELTLYCKQDSWVEVSADGKQQQAGIMRAGTSKVIKAHPPFDILIGNAPAIDIKYNGEPFDTTPFWRGKVASFTLGD
jgi:cytoskeleton protein RodZ